MQIKGTLEVSRLHLRPMTTAERDALPDARLGDAVIISDGTGIKLSTNDGAVWSDPPNQGGSAAVSAFESAADFEFQSIASAVNTVGKVAHKPVWNSTQNVLMVAQGAGAGSQWISANGVTVITPS